MAGDENALTFGQIVPVLLLASIVLTFKGVYTENRSVCQQVQDKARPMPSNDVLYAQVFGQRTKIPRSALTASDLLNSHVRKLSWRQKIAGALATTYPT
ncbi:MAG: hypothetical protein Q9179_005595 [Wetmoreana sp. 5 TL-2023]